MFFNKSIDQTSQLADQLAQSASHAIESTQGAASDAVDSLSHAMTGLGQQAEPVLNRAGKKVSTLAHRGLESVRDTSQYVSDSARRASNTTVNYIKDEPVKSALIAVAAGVAVVGLISWMRNSRDHR